MTKFVFIWPPQCCATVVEVAPTYQQTREAVDALPNYTRASIFEVTDELVDEYHALQARIEEFNAKALAARAEAIRSRG